MTAKKRLPLLLVLVCLLPASEAHAQFSESPASRAVAGGSRRAPAPTGRVGDALYVRGRLAGRIDPARINCLGHAAGVGGSVQTGTLPLGDTLRALGYTCSVAGPETLTDDVARGRSVMMVYFYAYPDRFRAEADRGLGASQLAERYGWKSEPWRQSGIFSNDGGDLPFDFHAIGYDHGIGRWDWVMHARDKDPDGSYEVDSGPDMAATLDPDRYFPADHVVTRLACVRE